MATTILIVDDDFDIRLLVRTAIELANDGLTVVGEAADGTEAFTVCNALDGPPAPDVVIRDNQMPELSGLEVAERILAEPPDQIIVLYSAYIDKSVRSRASQLGVAACVTKGEVRDLPELIRSLAA